MNCNGASAQWQEPPRNNDLGRTAAPDVFGLLGQRRADGRPALTHTAALAFFFFAQQAGQHGSVALTNAEIARALVVDRSTVHRLVGQLVAADLVRVERGAGPGGANVYRLAYQPCLAGGGQQRPAAEGDDQQLRLFAAPAQSKPTVEAPPALVELVDLWNGLGPSIVGHTVRLDAGADSSLMRAWRRMKRNQKLREAFADPPALEAAIRGATFCHCKPWFDFFWLFSSNKSGELHAVRLLDGKYTDTRGRKHDRSKYTAPGAGVW